MIFIDLGEWYRDRLASGYDPVSGSRILAARFACRQGHLSLTRRDASAKAGTAAREVSKGRAA